MSWTLAGHHPKTGEPPIAAVHIPDDLKQDVEDRVRSEGWTNLTWSRGERNPHDDDRDAPGDVPD